MCSLQFGWFIALSVMLTITCLIMIIAVYRRGSQQQQRQPEPPPCACAAFFVLIYLRISSSLRAQPNTDDDGAAATEANNTTADASAISTEAGACVNESVELNYMREQPAARDCRIRSDVVGADDVSDSDSDTEDSDALPYVWILSCSLCLPSSSSSSPECCHLFRMCENANPNIRRGIVKVPSFR